mmetsp:Transcript_22379/g.63899  ORF Transcript_22379/g.63899 Transcript_22379/m.63899 type:complete len:242 (-) Transcript_22379:574-1299(-)
MQSSIVAACILDGLPFLVRFKSQQRGKRRQRRHIDIALLLFCRRGRGRLLLWILLLFACSGPPSPLFPWTLAAMMPVALPLLVPLPMAAARLMMRRGCARLVVALTVTVAVRRSGWSLSRLPAALQWGVRRNRQSTACGLWVGVTGACCCWCCWCCRARCAFVPVPTTSTWRGRGLTGRVLVLLSSPVWRPAPRRDDIGRSSTVEADGGSGSGADGAARAARGSLAFPLRLPVVILAWRRR